MKGWLAHYEKLDAWLLKILAPLGFWGIGLLAVFDASSIPIPIDAFIIFYAWYDPHRFYLYVLMASAGSALGGLVPYFIGRAGGELVLLKRVNRARYERLRDRFEHQEFLALVIPSLLPPPTPWKLVVFAAGVFSMRAVNFMAAVFVGRIIRFGAEAVLVVFYGPTIVREISFALREHMPEVAGIVTALVALVVAFVIYRMKRRRTKPGMEPL